MLPLIAAIVLLIAACAVLALAVRQARSLRTTRLEVLIPGWPQGAGKVRIAHISDLHLPDGPVPPEQIVAAVEEAQPHIVVISGDILTWDTDLDMAVALIADLAAQGPVLCVTGNVEHTYRLDIDAFAEAIKPVGGLLLRDEVWTGTINGARVCVLGMEHRPDGAPDAGDALPESPEADLSLIVAHTPPRWVQVDRQRVHLYLCGHTHGGQIRVPVLGRRLAHSEMEWELKSGVFELPEDSDNWQDLRPVVTHEQACAGGGPWRHRLRPGRPLMCITRGIGCVMLPMRLGSPPEAISITIGGETAGGEPAQAEES